MKNFLCISNYNHDTSWIKNYTNKYVIYDRSDNGKSIASDLNVIKSPNIGYNLYDMFTFIIDNYNELPDVVTFCKSNIFPRHMSKERFEELMNNECFTPLFDHTYHHKPHMPICMFSCDGAWSELNSGISMPNPAIHPWKYFSSYNDLLNFLFVDPVIPNYITFAAGGNYVVPKANILKYSVNFYKNLKLFVSHCALPSEAHLIERALYTIWMCNFAVNKKANTLVDDNFIYKKEKGAKEDHRTLEEIQGIDFPDVKKVNIRTICELKLKCCDRPNMPARIQPYDMDEQVFSTLFSAAVDFGSTNFIFESENDAKEYLATNLFPYLKDCNPTFIVEKSYKR